ncbi:MAG: 3D domain-containing protein, partial [Nevskiales bacterium]
MKPKHPRDWLILTGLLLLLAPVEAREDPITHRALVVTATAYNSVPEQTDDDPDVAAWGDRLRPGVKSIAVSRDLLGKGLKRHARVRIHGLPGEYLVLDKMNERWENRIDIYMGEDTKAARYFGKRKVRIY